VVQSVNAGSLGYFRDATPRKSSFTRSGVVSTIPMDRHRYGTAVFQQLGGADKHITAGEMTGASAKKKSVAVALWTVRPAAEAQTRPVREPAGVTCSHSQVPLTTKPSGTRRQV
jgi:hypothetical protein